MAFGERRIEPGRNQRHRGGDHRHALALDERKYGFRIASRREHHAAAGVQRRHHPGRGEVVVVRQRQDRHEHRVLAEVGEAAALLGVVDVVLVRARDELGQRGRAAREQHQRHFARIERRGVERCPRVGRRHRCVEQLAQRGLSRERLAGDEHLLQRGAGGAHFLGHRAVVEIAQPVGNDVAHRAGGGDEMLHFGVAVRAQRHHRDRPGADQAKVGVNELGNIGQLQHHAVERFEAGMYEVRGEPLDALHELRVADAFRAVHQRDLVRARGRRGGERAGNRDALPIAARPIVARERVGPRRAACEHEPSRCRRPTLPERPRRAIELHQAARRAAAPAQNTNTPLPVVWVSNRR